MTEFSIQEQNSQIRNADYYFQDQAAITVICLKPSNGHTL